MVLLELSHTHATATATTTCTVKDERKLFHRYQKLSVGYFYFYIFFIHTTTVVVTLELCFSIWTTSLHLLGRKGIDCTLPGVVLIVYCSKTFLIRLPPPPGIRIGAATRSRITVRPPPGFALRCTKLTEHVPSCPVCTYSHSASTKWSCRTPTLSFLKKRETRAWL